MNFSEFLDLVKSSRSIRRFKAEAVIPEQILRELIELARLTPSSRNRQPLKYVLVNSPAARADVFSCLNWAKALTKWGGPQESERPGAYIVILGDSSLVTDKPPGSQTKYSVDHGITAQTIMLGARTLGFGGCILASVDRPLLRAKLAIEERYEILLMLALGVPDEDVFLEAVPEDGSVSYWRDKDGGHHVPKRSLSDLIVGVHCES